MHTCTHAHMHTCTHAHMHTCTHAHMHTCTHTHIHMYTHIHTCTKPDTLQHTRTRYDATNKLSNFWYKIS